MAHIAGVGDVLHQAADAFSDATDVPIYKNSKKLAMACQCAFDQSVICELRRRPDHGHLVPLKERSDGRAALFDAVAGNGNKMRRFG